MIKKIKFEKLANKSFLITPLPLSDELFSSWLVRTAYAHHTHPHTFINIYFNHIKNYNFFQTNIDVNIDEKTLTQIYNQSHKIINLKTLTLQSYSGYLQEKISYNSMNKFLVPLRFCPLCLREDEVPYFRKHWSVVFCTICLKHLCYMYDKCPQCNTKLDISKMHNNSLEFTHCNRCGFDLKKAKKRPIASIDRRFIKCNKKLFKVFNSGYINLDNNQIYSFYFFDVLAQLVKLILVHKYEKYINYLKLKSFKSKHKRSFKPAYLQLSIKEQFIIFGIVMELFDNYPKKIKRFIKENKLTHWRIIKDMVYVPFWYENLINDTSPRFISITKIITKEEIINAKKYLKSQNIPRNKANLTRLLGCNFFSIYNKLHI